MGRLPQGEWCDARISRRWTRGHRGDVAGSVLRLLPEEVVPSSYWLAQCEGFLVDVGDAPLGVVDELVVSAGPEQPEAVALVVSTGWFGRRRLVIPVEQVERIVPEERRIVLVSSARYRSYARRTPRRRLGWRRSA